MFRPYPVFIGTRYTAAKRSNHFISFISLSSMIGLMLGVAVLITVLSVMNGFDRELRQRILGMVSHATIKGYGPITDWTRIRDHAIQHPQIAAAAPFIHAQGMVTAQGNVNGVMINGILPDEEAKVSIIHNHIIKGAIDDLRSGEFGIVIGELLANYLQVGIGDKLTVVLPEAAITPAGVFPRLKRFTIVGVFKVGAELDGSLTYVHIEDAARLARMEGQVEGVRLKLHNLFQAKTVAGDLASSLGSNYYATDWTRTHGNLFSAIQMEKTMIGLLLMMIVAVAAFNIISTLVMVVTDKKADIAILRTMGMSPRGIMSIFIVQGSLIGFIGTTLGTGLGILMALNVSAMIAGLETLLGTRFLDPNVYFISDLPSELIWNDVFVITGVAFLLSLLATLYPAYRASKVEPAEALRYE
jgi:lipoprotein-releasing system permease protein